jgi:hypothetical protein
MRKSSSIAANAIKKVRLLNMIVINGKETRKKGNYEVEKWNRK